MEQNRAPWIVTGLFGVLLAVQVWKFRELELPVHLPLILLGATGVLAGVIPSLREWQTRAMFVCAYGSAFVWMWASGRPGLEIGRYWLATTVLLLAIMAVLAYVQSQGAGRKWSWAFFLAVGFGLAVAFLSGPEGEAGWLVRLVEQVFGYTDEDWRARMWTLFYIRKTIHFMGYGLAAFLTAWTVWKQGGKLGACWAAGYAWPLPLAVFDEWHQSTVSGRTGAVGDVVLDAAGMTAFLVLFTVIYKRKEKKEWEARL